MIPYFYLLLHPIWDVWDKKEMEKIIPVLFFKSKIPYFSGIFSESFFLN